MIITSRIVKSVFIDFTLQCLTFLGISNGKSITLKMHDNFKVCNRYNKIIQWNNLILSHCTYINLWNKYFLVHLLQAITYNLFFRSTVFSLFSITSFTTYFPREWTKLFIVYFFILFSLLLHKGKFSAKIQATMVNVLTYITIRLSTRTMKLSFDCIK